MKKLLLNMLFILTLSACSEADVISNNLSTEADRFNILRRVVFYNGITDTYLLEVTGYCSLGNYDRNGEVTITCKIGENQYKKHFLGLSDNVTFFAEQLDGKNVSKDHYKVVFRPQTIMPDIDLD